MKKARKYVFDIEVFPNYFCVVAKQLNGKDIFVIDSDNFNQQKKRLYDIVSKNVMISYAGHGFDDLIINELLRYKNRVAKRFLLNKNINEIQNLYKEKYKNGKCEFYSYDIADEYDLKLGVKGFEFNLGENIEEQDFANFNKSIKKDNYDEIVEKVVDYCLKDVLATEKMYNYVSKNKNNWEEKENLLNIITTGNYKNSMKLKTKIKYLYYNNDKLLSLILKNNLNIEQPKMIPKKVFKIVEESYYLNDNVYKLSIKDDFLYNSLLENKMFKKNDLNILEKISKNLLLQSSYLKGITKKYERIILKKLKKYFRKKNIKVLEVFKNEVFLLIDKNVEELKTKMENKYSNILEINYISNFLKDKKSLLYKIDKKITGTNEFDYGDLIIPRQHIWLIKVLKNYFFDKKNIETEIKELFLKNPDVFFLYASIYENIYACDNDGKVLYEDNDRLRKNRKYRLYFSKTGNYKVVIQEKNKYYKKFGFGDVNSNLYKVKKVETNVSEFENYEDMDLCSYIDYAKNYIDENFSEESNS